MGDDGGNCGNKNVNWGSRDGAVVEHLPPTNVARV